MSRQADRPLGGVELLTAAIPKRGANSRCPSLGDHLRRGEQLDRAVRTSAVSETCSCVNHIFGRKFRGSICKHAAEAFGDCRKKLLAHH